MNGIRAPFPKEALENSLTLCHVKTQKGSHPEPDPAGTLISTLHPPEL